MDPQARHIGQIETEDERDDAEVEIEVTRTRIEATRAEMGETIEAIKDRLNPQHLAEQAKETVREATLGRAQEAASHAVDAAKDAVGGAVDTARQAMSNVSDTARDAGSSMMETIKRNPAAVGLIGIGLSWLCMSNWREREEHRTGDRRYAYDELRGSEIPLEYQGQSQYQSVTQFGEQPAGAAGVSRTWHEARDKVSDVTGQVQEKAGEIASRAKEKAGDLANRAQHKVGELGSEAAFKAQKAGYAFQDMLNSNPVAAGAVALGVGAALGMMIPETEAENRWMGEARDQLVDRAQEKAQDVKERAQTVAQEAMHAAKETAREEARNQGLNPTA